MVPNEPGAIVGVNDAAFTTALGFISLLRATAVAPNSAVGELLASRDPILVVFDGTPERIHAASRTRISGLIMDVMLLQNLSQATAAQQGEVTRQLRAY